MTIDELVLEMSEELDAILGDLQRAQGRDEHSVILDQYTQLYQWYLKAIEVKYAADVRNAAALKGGDGDE